jgi:hypothetical protein
MQIGKPFAICLVALGMVGCVPQVHYSPAVAGILAKPKAQSCRIEFFRSKAPDRPYDELGGLYVEGSTEPEDLQTAMSRRACELGADAVLITRDYTPAVGRLPGTMTGTAVRYRGENGTAAASADPCQAAFAVGKWSLCQVAGSAVYVWWTGDGESVAAKFPIKGTGAWFVRRGGKVLKVEGHECRGENNPTCGQTTQVPADAEVWAQPAIGAVPALVDDTQFSMDKTRFELTAKELVVRLPDDHTVVLPAERARIEIGFRDVQRQGLWPVSRDGHGLAGGPDKVAPIDSSPDACMVAFLIGKWALCQVGTAAVYVRWTGEGPELAIKFPAQSGGPWFLRREGRIYKVQGHDCRGENSPTCGAATQDPADGEVWEQLSIANGQGVDEEGASFSLGKTRFELSAKEILIRLPDNHTVGLPAGRAVVTMGMWNGLRSEIGPGFSGGSSFYN